MLKGKMKTKEQLIKEGYPEDWDIECPFCHSHNCHRYKNKTVCFDCEDKIKD